MGQNASEGNSVQKIAVLYILIWTISPFMEIDLKWRLLVLAAVVVWLLIAFQRNFSFDNLGQKGIFLVLLVLVVAIIEKRSFSAALRPIAIYMLVICYWINVFYRDRWGELSGIVPIILILLAFFNLRSGQAVASNPNLARLLVRDDEETYVYLRQGIGGYSLIYPQVIIFPAIITWIQKALKGNKPCFIIGCIWLYTYISFILHAGYSTAIAVSAIGLIVLYFYRGSNPISALIVSLILFLSFLALILYSSSLRNMLLQFFDGTAVAKKINDLVSSSQKGSAQGSIYDRVIAYQASFNCLLHYPIIGGLWWKSGGGHSAILDMFAKYGIFGGYVYTKILIAVPNYYRVRKNNQIAIKIVNATLVTILFVALLDSFTYAFMGMIMIVLPLLLTDIRKWSGVH